MILAALAAHIGSNDAGASIAFYGQQLLVGSVACGSIGECLYVLEDQTDIRYVPLSDRMTIMQPSESAETPE